MKKTAKRKRAAKSVRLTNFTGTIKKLKNGQVKITGRRKRKK